MDRTMKAAVVRGFGQPLVIEEVAVPRPGPGELLVKIEACGVCHTDLHAAEGDWPLKPAPPFIPGHEGVGHVVAVGAGVNHVREGDRVGIPWLYSACGHCVHCLGGWETLCEQQQNTGYSVNGSFAQYALADAGYVGHLPKEIGFVEIAPVLCAGVLLSCTGNHFAQQPPIAGNTYGALVARSAAASANVGDQFGDHATLHFLTVKGQFRGAANMVFTLPQSTA